MTNKKLLGIVAIAFLAGTIVSSTPIQKAVATNPALTDIFTAVQNIENTLLPAIQTTDNAIKAKTDNLPPDPASNSHIDAAIASIPAGASQTSVNNLQTTANAIKAKTDNLPSDPASNTAISNAQSAINTNTNTQASTILTNLNDPSTGLKEIKKEVSNISVVSVQSASTKLVLGGPIGAQVTITFSKPAVIHTIVASDLNSNGAWEVGQIDGMTLHNTIFGSQSAANQFVAVPPPVHGSLGVGSSLTLGVDNANPGDMLFVEIVYSSTGTASFSSP